MSDKSINPEEATSVEPIDLEKNTSAIQVKPEKEPKSSEDAKFEACWWNGQGFSPGARIAVGGSILVCCYDPKTGRGWWARNCP